MSLVFFFKQRTAYEMRISDWSSDVCSSDLGSMTKRKIFPDAEAALAGVLFDGMTIMSGGFGLSGNPEHLIAGLLASGVKDLTIISHNCGADGFGLWTLLNNGQIRKMVATYIDQKSTETGRWGKKCIRK